MNTLELKDCILYYNEAYLLEKDIGGVMMPSSYHSSYWYHPEFLAQLPAPTWGELKKWHTTNKESLDVDFRRSIEDILENLTLDMDKEILLYKHRRSINFSLFSQEEENSKPEVVWDGVRRFVASGQYTMYTYPLDEVAQPSGSPRIREWNYAPEEFTFMDMNKEKTNRYFGLELEVNTSIPWHDLHRVMTQVEPIQEEFLYAVSDSSVSGTKPHSYELVSQPMSPRRMRTEFSKFFKKLERLVVAKGKTLDDVFDMESSSNGIHIHVDRRTFDKNEGRRSSVLARTHRRKFISVWNGFEKVSTDLVSVLAGRDVTTSHYCRVVPEYRGRTTGYLLSQADIRHGNGRYCGCNETRKTLEVRVFSGVPKLKHILRCIDSVEAMIDFTEVAPHSIFNRRFSSAFSSWVHQAPKSMYRTLRETI